MRSLLTLLMWAAVIAMLMVAIATSGCSSGQWVRKGTDFTQTKKDVDHCYENATFMNRGRAFPRIQRDFNWCMYGRGYHFEEK